jgi:beta-fructofuranosidase
MPDRDGRRILWGWITEARPNTDLLKAGWAGAVSLPRVLSLSLDNQLQTSVAPEAKMLRAKSIAENQTTHTSEALQIFDLAAELDLRLRSLTGDFRLHLYSGAGDFASISCSDKGRTLRVNELTCPLPTKRDADFRFHIFLDGSVMEVFVDDLNAMTARVYNIPSGPLRLRLEGDAKLLSRSAWQITPISKNRLTS